MTPEKWREVVAVFEAIVDLCVDDRERELRARCGADSELAERVRRLCADHDRAAAACFLGLPPLERVATEASAVSDGLLGRTIGGFRLVRVLGQGGMGMVFEAVQESLARRVAVKILKPVLATGPALRRFEVEAEILARLRHENIAQVIASGVEPATVGPLALPLPWYAMELLDGAQDIVSHANARALGTDARLELFARVSDAVGHAHRRGVIHRDLKPANVLIDSNGAPKVIDFGIAHATREASDGAGKGSFLTRAGDFLGTLRYMAPEQVDGRADRVDVRTDVYALGVVLFELLTGSTPLDVDDTTFDEAVRRIREDVPRRPSANVPGLRREIDWIVGKCLEKDPERRYPSVLVLREDLRRLAANLPLAAGPPELTYRLATFARRHRIAMAIGAVLLTILVSWVVSLRAARDRATESARIATREANKMEDVVGIIEYAIGTARVGRSAQALPFADILAEIERAIDHEARDPEVVAALLIEIGSFHHRLGDAKKAESHLSRAIELLEKYGFGDSKDAEVARRRRTEVLVAIGDLAKAEAALGADSADGSVALKALDVAGLHERMVVLLGQGRYLEVEPVARELIARVSPPNSDPSRNLPSFQFSLANVLLQLARYAEAESLLQDALHGEETLHAEEPARAAFCKATLAGVYVETGRAAEAASLSRAAAEVCAAELGPNHRKTLVGIGNEARARSRLGDHASAIELARTVVERRVDSQGAEHPDVIAARVLLGEVEERAGNIDAAREQFRAAADLGARVLRERHPNRAYAEACALCLEFSTSADKAAVRLGAQRARESLSAELGENHPRLAELDARLAALR